ncbi:hypothetical protein G5C51_33785 [Streptomyces sp. A7024]|uniref:Uncharacterized protein n=1 Tax=Streptomyces coryli TaxID=1128680 RepID=A0A6G4UA21_9ACTN|nr:MrpF/PhaF family protein [Streptomyces coryli]NGN68852.1 hypothetical protein [Streptomyces coryli]
MNPWLLTAAALISADVPAALWSACQGAAERRLPALSLFGTLTAVLMLLVAQGTGRSSYVDLALVQALLGPVGVLVFARGLVRERSDDP